MSGKPIAVKLTGKTVGTILLSVAGALTLGVGMCMTMVWEGLMLQGIIVGVVEGFTKMTDKSVDQFLTREGESA